MAGIVESVPSKADPVAIYQGSYRDRYTGQLVNTSVVNLNTREYVYDPKGNVVEVAGLLASGGSMVDRTVEIPLGDRAARKETAAMLERTPRPSSASKLKKGSRRTRFAVQALPENVPSVDPLVNNDRGRIVPERSRPTVAPPSRVLGGPVQYLGGRGDVQSQVAFARAADKTAAGVRSPVAELAGEAKVHHLPAFIRNLIR